MVANERIIKFPLSIEKGVFSSYSELKSMPYCICYQYDISDHGHGPYGFHSERAEGLLKYLFNKLIFIDFNGFSQRSESVVSKRGFYFYADNSANQEIISELESYKLAILKSKMISKKGEGATLPLQPLLMKLNKEGVFDSCYINQLIEKKCQFFLFIDYYTDIAGRTLVLFDTTLLNKIKEYAKDHDIQVIEVSSDKELLAW